MVESCVHGTPEQLQRRGPWTITQDAEPRSFGQTPKIIAMIASASGNVKLTIAQIISQRLEPLPEFLACADPKK